MSGSATAGTCPTQELVDAYEMANGKPAITGYSDDQHLQPIINTESGYDETKPYEDRDPRFYATVFYNGSVRGEDEISTVAGANCGLNATSIRYTHTKLLYAQICPRRIQQKLQFGWLYARCAPR